MSAPPVRGTGARVVGEEYSLLQFATAILRTRRLLVLVPLVLAVLTGAVVLLLPLKFTTRVSFTASSASGLPSQLAGLAAQFNVSLPGQDNTQGPEFYADLVRRPEALVELVEASYRVAGKDGDSTNRTFIDLYEIDESTRGMTIAAAVKLLNADILSIDPNRNTGVLSVTVRTKWPEISQQIATRIIAQVDAYNQNNRQTQAKAESEFITERLKIAREELRAVEDSAEQFLKRNREFRSDPRLLFQYERLQRAITLRQGVFETLSQGLEQTRIEAVRNTPSISLVEQPMLALRFDRRNTLVKVVAAAFVGLLLVVGFAIVRAVSDEGQANRANELAAFREELAAARRDVGRLLSRATAGNSREDA